MLVNSEELSEPEHAQRYTEENKARTLLTFLKELGKKRNPEYCSCLRCDSGVLHQLSTQTQPNHRRSSSLFAPNAPIERVPSRLSNSLADDGDKLSPTRDMGLVGTASRSSFRHLPVQCSPLLIRNHGCAARSAFSRVLSDARVPSAGLSRVESNLIDLVDDVSSTWH